MSRIPKVPIVFGAAAVVLVAILLVVDRNDRGESRSDPPPQDTSWMDRGMYFPVPSPSEMTEEQRELIQAIGYSAGFEAAPEGSGVTRYDAERAQDGVNLVLSAHASAAFLMDMKGETLHTWSKQFADVWISPRISDDGKLTFGETIAVQPGWDAERVSRLPASFREISNPGYKYFRRAYLYPDGDLLAVFSYLGLVKLDRDSKVVWSHSLMAHHDLDVGPDGSIYVLASEPREATELGEGGFVLDDYVAVLDKTGTLLRRISVLDGFLDSEFAPMVTGAPQHFDVLHTNTLSLLDDRLAERVPGFEKGNLLVSCRNIGAIAVIDPELGVVVWAMQGDWVMQHEPVVLDAGRLLLFDNQGNGGFSRVIELDPITREIAWEFSGSPPESFYAIGLGTAARLANGNTLITESTRGRAFEITPEKEVVWEYVNPERVHEDDTELIAAVFEVLRLPTEYTASWLGATPAN